MSKKKILILVDWYEPGFKAGGPIQSVRNFVEAMHDNFELSILTSDRDINEGQPYENIQSNRWILRSPGVSVYYADAKKLTSKKMAFLIAEKEPDFIYLNSLYSVRFTIIPLILKWRKKIGAKIVLAPRGMLQEGAIKIKSNKKRLFISLLNSTGIVGKIRFQATDDQEDSDIKKNFPGALSVIQVSNFSAPLPRLSGSIPKIPGKLRAIYISRISAKKNILFLLKLLDKISPNVEMEFSIYGEVEDEKYWQASLDIIQKLPRNIQVKYLGALPHEKVSAAIEANHIFVLPTLGENFGHIIFEAFSAGRPVLISNKTPWIGLRGKNMGWDISLDEPGEWISAIEELARFDQATFNQWCLASRDYAKVYLERTDLKPKYLELFS